MEQHASQSTGGAAALSAPLDDSYEARQLDVIASEIARLGRHLQIPAADGLHLAVSLTHRAMLAITELRTLGWSRDRIRQRLEQARAIHAESPFIRRLQEWPRGYQGDFETIEYLVQQRNRAEPGRLSFWLEQYALSSALAQQHRNKVDLQAHAVLDTVFAPANSADPPRLLVLAAGGSPDLRLVQSVLATQRFHAVLLDQDADALAFSAGQLPLIADRLTLVNRNVVRGLPSVRAHAPFNLVLAGGLFDYLPAKLATMVLRYTREHLLTPGGRVFFTNIAEPNLCRVWMEHLVNWELIHRTDNDLRALCLDAGFSEANITVTSDRTAMTFIVTCRTSA